MSFPLADTGSAVRTYSGVLDDVMIRYGRGREFFTPDFFNKMILKNVVFGSGMFLNDGYLVNHPLAGRYMANHESLLSHMISTGFIRILSRERDADRMSTMPERMAEAGNESFIQLVNSDAYKEYIGPAFRRVARSVFYNGTVRAWPLFDMSAGFCDLMDRVFTSSPAKLGLVLTTKSDLDRVADNFRLRQPRKGNPRDSLEKAASEVARSKGDRYDERMAEIMEIGNQAYHYNFGMTLNAEESSPVAADTTMGMAFDELLNKKRIERAQLNSVPLINFPKEIPFDDGTVFLPFIRDVHPLSEAKRGYLMSLNRLLMEDARDVSTLAKEAREATDVYLSEMKKHFRPIFGETDVNMVFDGSATFGMSSEIGGSPGVTAAPTANLAVALQNASLAQKRRFLVERFELQDVTHEFEHGEDTSSPVTIGDIRSQLASLAFDATEAQAFVSQLPRFGQP